MVARDIALARLTGARVHFQHLSTAGSVELVRAAKATGARVTAEATTHHFTLTDAVLAGYDPVFKVNPPLRTDADVAAVQGRPGRRHHRRHRHRPRPAHPGGQGGAVRPGAARDARARDRAGARPHRARPAGLDLARSSPCSRGSRPRIAGLADDARRPGRRRASPPTCACSTPPPPGSSIPPARASRSRNNPYAGRTLTGRVRHTIVAGEPVVIDAEAQR